MNCFWIIMENWLQFIKGRKMCACLLFFPGTSITLFITVFMRPIFEQAAFVSQCVHNVNTGGIHGFISFHLITLQRLERLCYPDTHALHTAGIPNILWVWNIMERGNIMEITIYIPIADAAVFCVLQGYFDLQMFLRLRRLWVDISVVKILI